MTLFPGKVSGKVSGNMGSHETGSRNSFPGKGPPSKIIDFLITMFKVKVSISECRIDDNICMELLEIVV